MTLLYSLYISKGHSTFLLLLHWFKKERPIITLSSDKVLKGNNFLFYISVTVISLCLNTSCRRIHPHLHRLHHHRQSDQDYQVKHLLRCWKHYDHRVLSQNRHFNVHQPARCTWQHYNPYQAHNFRHYLDKKTFAAISNHACPPTTSSFSRFTRFLNAPSSACCFLHGISLVTQKSERPLLIQSNWDVKPRKLLSLCWMSMTQPTPHLFCSLKQNIVYWKHAEQWLGSRQHCQLINNCYNMWPGFEAFFFYLMFTPADRFSQWVYRKKCFKVSPAECTCDMMLANGTTYASRNLEERWGIGM